MKRTKKVFSSASQVMHLWANQTQSDARSGNVFFEGDTIYSYGYHYKLGRIHKVGKQSIAVINSEIYSNTTSKHSHEARSACSHIPTIGSSNVDSILTGVKERQAELKEGLESFFKRRSFWSVDCVKSELEAIEEFNAFCDAVKQKKYKIKVSKSLIAEMKAHVKKCIKRKAELAALRKTPEYQAKKEAAAARKEELLEIKAAKEAESWRNGGPITKLVKEFSPQLIRIVGDEVQTSRGAIVPLSDARRLLTLVTNKARAAGSKVGSFTVTSVNSDTVKIGCHEISIAEGMAVLKVA